MWVLGLKPGSSGRAVCDYNYWAISPTSMFLFLAKQLSVFLECAVTSCVQCAQLDQGDCRNWLFIWVGALLLFWNTPLIVVHPSFPVHSRLKTSNPLLRSPSLLSCLPPHFSASGKHCFSLYFSEINLTDKQPYVFILRVHCVGICKIKRKTHGSSSFHPEGSGIELRLSIAAGTITPPCVSGHTWNWSFVWCLNLQWPPILLWCCKWQLYLFFNGQIIFHVLFICPQDPGWLCVLAVVNTAVQTRQCHCISTCLCTQVRTCDLMSLHTLPRCL